MRRLAIVLGLGLCLVIGLLFSAPARAESQRRVVRVGWYLTGAEGEAAPTGGASIQGAHGYDYEYLQALAQYTNWSYEYVTGTWEECLSWLETGDIDLMGFVQKTPERELIFGYPELPMAVTSGLLVTDVNSPLRVASAATLAGIKVGRVAGNAYNEDFAAYCQENGFTVEYSEYEAFNDLSLALAAGEIQAAVVTEEDKTETERVLLTLSADSQYFVTSLRNTALLKELDQAMIDLNAYCPYLNGDLHQKYFSLNTDGKPTFTAAEQEFIAAHPTIMVLYDAGWPPIEYWDEESGAYIGVSPDLFALLSEKCGIEFVYQGSTSGQVLAGLESEEDRNVLTTISHDYGWAESHHVYITQPFITSAIVKLGRNLNEPDAVAAINEKAFFTYLLAEPLSGLRTIHYAKQAERLEAVRSGAADYTFVTEDQANYYRSIPRYANLQVERMVGYEQGICISVSQNSDPALLTILSKSLASISHDEMTAIVRKNTVNAYHLTLGDRLYANRGWLLGGAVVAAALIALVWAALRVGKAKRLASEQANRAKSDFLSHVSHDIRTPLNAIIGITALALEEPDAQLKQDYLAKINESGKYLLGLINDTLDMSKIESGKLTLHLEPVNYAEIYNVVTTVIMPKAQEKKLELRLRQEGVGEGYIMADKLRLEQILLNLLNNAVKFTPTHGLITCQTTVTARSPEQISYRISVSDTGVGMSAEFMEKLFLPFEQERNRLSVENAGTGLGLSIVKSLVDQMGGQISCQSRKNVGSEFVIQLTSPVASEEQRAALPQLAQLPDEQVFPGRRVLLVEDNSMNALVAEKMLEKKGILVTYAANGQEAVDAYLRQPPPFFDAVLMDVHMPVMDGLAATCAIRAAGRADSASLPILALSANAYDENRRECFAAGMNDHVAKPIEPPLLFDALRRAFLGQEKPEA